MQHSSLLAAPLRAWHHLNVTYTCRYLVRDMRHDAPDS